MNVKNSEDREKVNMKEASLHKWNKERTGREGC